MSEKFIDHSLNILSIILIYALLLLFISFLVWYDSGKEKTTIYSSMMNGCEYNHSSQTVTCPFRK